MIENRRARGFEPGHQPVFAVPKRKKGGATANHVPSRKSVSGEGIRAASPLMRDFLWHLEVDPSVRLISPYPVELEYQTYDPRGAVVPRVPPTPARTGVLRPVRCGLCHP